MAMMAAEEGGSFTRGWGIAMLYQLWHDEHGLTTVEYALILAVMGLAAFAVAQLIGARVRGNADRGTGAVTGPS